MALNIDRVAVTMDVAGSESRRAQRPRSADEQRELIREIVVEVLRTELERVRREVG